MVEILHWLTLYAPVLFAIQMWFGPGWCCPPPCKDTVPCSHCNVDTAPREFSIWLDGFDNGTTGCTGGDKWNGTWIITSVPSFGSECRWEYNLDSAEFTGMQVKGLSGCVNATQAGILLQLTTVIGGVQFELQCNASTAGLSMETVFRASFDPSDCDVSSANLPWVRDTCGGGNCQRSWRGSLSTCEVTALGL